MEFSRQGYWSGQLFPSLGDLPDPGIVPRPPALQADFIIWATREPLLYASPKSKASLGISPAPSDCIDVDSLSKLDHVPPLHNILRMSTHPAPRPSRWDLVFRDSQVFPHPLPLTHAGSSPGSCLCCSFHQMPFLLMAAGSLSGLQSLILLTPPHHPHALHVSPPTPAPHGEDLCLFCSPLFLQNREKWPIHSRDLIHEQMHERVVEKNFKVASLLTEKRFAFIRLSVFILRSLSLLLEQLPRLPLCRLLLHFWHLPHFQFTCLFCTGKDGPWDESGNNSLSFQPEQGADCQIHILSFFILVTEAVKKVWVPDVTLEKSYCGGISKLDFSAGVKGRKETRYLLFIK